MKIQDDLEIYFERFQMNPPADLKEDYSFSGADDAQTIISYDGISEFAQSVNGADQKSVMSIMDELMEALYVMQPKLYRSVISKLTGL